MAEPAARMRTSFLESSSEQHPSLSVPRQPASRTNVRHTNAWDATSLGGGNTNAVFAHDPRSELLAAIHEQVIPRLLRGHDASLEADKAGGTPPTAEDALELSCLAARADLQASLALALTMLGSGLTLETVFLQLIAPAARRLGADWVDDLRSFSEVTVGLGTLHQLVNMLVPPPAPSCNAQQRQERPMRGRALLVGAPGEQHTLGLSIFGELLRHARWSVVVELAMPAREVLSCVRAQPIDAVGISLSSATRLTVAGELVASIKRAARIRSIEVVIGGPVDLADEVMRMGATFHADGPEAVRWLSARYDARLHLLSEHDSDNVT